MKSFPNLVYVEIATEPFAVQSYQPDDFVHLVNHKASIRIDLQNKTFSSHAKQDAAFQNYVAQLNLDELITQLKIAFPDCQSVLKKMADLPHDRYSELKADFLSTFHMAESIFDRKRTQKLFRVEEIQFLTTFFITRLHPSEIESIAEVPNDLKSG